MTHADILRALASLRPGAIFNLRGGDPAGLEWPDQTQIRPTGQEITAEFERQKAAGGRFFLARQLVEDILEADDILAIQLAGAVRPSTTQSRSAARLWAMLLSRGDLPIDLDGPTANQGVKLLTVILGTTRAETIVKKLRTIARP